MARLFQSLLFFLARCTENDLRRQIEFLKVENEMLRQRVPKQRIFLKKEERAKLIKLGKGIGPGVRHLVTIVHPRTYQRWISEKNAGKPNKEMGRPKTLESIREIVVRIAKETGWGYGRILGELKKLRIRAIGQSTIKNILKDAGMLPRPKKGPGTWDEFLKMHADTLCQIDFFSKCIWTRKGLRQCFVLAFLHVATRRVDVSPCTFQPDAKWMKQQAEAFLDHARSKGLRVETVNRDRDGKYVPDFDAVFKNAGVRVIPTAVHAPNQNAFIERWIQSIKQECLQNFIVFGQKHFDLIVAEYTGYYNDLRPHQSLNNKPLTGEWGEVDDPLKKSEQVVCNTRLGGLLTHYVRCAA
jgi:transposase InsO family protein